MLCLLNSKRADVLGNAAAVKLIGQLVNFRSANAEFPAQCGGGDLFAAMCRMAAVDGRLSIKAAKEIEIRYIRRIEKSSTVTEISNLRQAMVAEFVSRVHDLTVSPGLSQPIRDCCDYIKNHFMEPLALSDIAKSVCYSEYYLTRKFRREMGISLREYVNPHTTKVACFQRTA